VGDLALGGGKVALGELARVHDDARKGARDKDFSPWGGGGEGMGTKKGGLRKFGGGRFPKEKKSRG